MNKLPCLLSLGVALNACAEPLGRLFFTPEQRRQLEQAPAATSPPAPMHLDGCISSSGGLNLRWVDGQLESGAAPGPKVGDSLLHPLLPPGSLSVDRGPDGGRE